MHTPGDGYVLLQESPASQAVKRRLQDDPTGEVSDDDPSDLGDVDDILSLSGSELGHGDETEMEIEIVFANRQLNNMSVDAILAREYGGEPPRAMLPAVNAKLAKVVNSWLTTVPKREHIKDMFKNAMLPENVEGLLPTKINDVVYQRLPFKAKINDQKLRGINTYFSRGIGPLINVLDNLLQAESLINKEQVKVSLKNEGLFLDDWKLDVKGLRSWLAEAVKILSIGSCVVIQKCQSGLKPFLDTKYHNLLKPTVPITRELLGPDLEQKITDGQRALEVARKLTNPPRFRQRFRPRGRGGPGGFTPGYNPGFRRPFPDKKGTNTQFRGRGKFNQGRNYYNYSNRMQHASTSSGFNSSRPTNSFSRRGARPGTRKN